MAWGDGGGERDCAGAVRTQRVAQQVYIPVRRPSFHTLPAAWFPYPAGALVSIPPWSASFHTPRGMEILVDAHTLGELGRAYAVVPPHPNRPEALLAALEGGQIVGTASSHRVNLASTWAKGRSRWGR